ncbi:MAG: hypothetical protein ACYCTI_02870 [Acidimicrobiales bacterium]
MLDYGILTDIMRAAVAQTGALLVGLDNRIKALASLKRKLGDALVLAPELSLQEAAEQIYQRQTYLEGRPALRGPVPHSTELSGG